jgi:hypothetical protein
MTPHWPGRFFSNLELIVEMHKPPNFKVIDEICVGPLALHRRCRLERQDSANCNATSAAAIRNGSFTSTPAVPPSARHYRGVGWIGFDPDALVGIPRIANAIGNAAAQSSAMNQNARGPNAP